MAHLREIPGHLFSERRALIIEDHATVPTSCLMIRRSTYKNGRYVKGQARGGGSVSRCMYLFLFLLVGACTGGLYAQDISGILVHAYVSQGFLFTSSNNYLSMKSSDGSPQWTDAAVNISDPLADNLRVGIQLHMYQLGEFGGSNVQIDWASGDYKVNDHVGIRAGKVKTVWGLFNDSQDIDAVFLWILLPQGSYSIDHKSFYLAHVGGDVYGTFSLGKRAGTLHYDGYAGQATVDLNDGYIKQFADIGLVFTSSLGGKTYGGDLHWETPFRGLTIGSSGNMQAVDGTAPTGSVHSPAFLAPSMYASFSRGKVYLAGEYDRIPINASVTLGSAVIPFVVDGPSWFAMGSYQLRKNVQVGTYYSHYVNKAADTTQPANYSKDWVVSGRYDFNPYFYAKIEGPFPSRNCSWVLHQHQPKWLDPELENVGCEDRFQLLAGLSIAGRKSMRKARCLMLLLGSLGSWSAAGAQDVVLVANKGVQISEITNADLHAIFMGTRTRFADGSHAVPVTLKGGPAHEVFLKNHLGEDPEEFRLHWRKVVFTGEGAMPKAFDSESALIEYVAATPGAVGYVSRLSSPDRVKLLAAVK
jgi:hypothetical protein